MVGLARKREAVGHLQRELELSQRRACRVVGQPRAMGLTRFDGHLGGGALTERAHEPDQDC
jgi:hypothetical protein